MLRSLSARLASLLLAGFLLFTLGAIPAAVGAAEPTVRPGERVHFSSRGFIPGERVDFWVTGPDAMSRPRFPAAPADDAGAVDWSWDVPADAPAGQWIAVARGVRSDHQAPSPFTVLASTAPPREQRAEPPAGAPGTTFRFTVGGLTPDERFGAWVRGPDGRDRDLDAESDEVPPLTVDAAGRLIWFWTAPADSPPGAWRALARSHTGTTLLEVPFTLTGTAPPVPERRVEPSVGTPGTSFEIVVGGLTPGEVAGGWLSTPNGAPVEGTPYLVVDSAGFARWRWTAPADAQAGRWQAVTRGVESRREVVLDLTISGSSPGPAPLPDPRASVEPTLGQPGSSFRFSVSGMDRNDRELSFWFIDPTGAPVATFEQIPVDNEGRASWNWEAPRLAAPGLWTMTARGRNSRREFTVNFTIEVPTLPTASVTPAAGPSGSSFSFQATQLNPLERVDNWAIAPNGASIHGNFDVRANRQGIAAWNWTAPADAPPGEWVMIVNGRDSGLSFRIPFTITP
jgi:hypothetical protein